MKEYLKKTLVHVLWLQVQRLRERHKPLVIVVGGSVGKTSTKTAIATVLSQHMQVAARGDNYDDLLSVPLTFFEQKLPFKYNLFGWLLVLVRMELKVKAQTGPQAVVLELASEQPGDMNAFKQRLRADWAVMTGIDEQSQVTEILQLAELADKVLVNADTVEKKYQSELVDSLSYGQNGKDCKITLKHLTPELQREASFGLAGKENYTATLNLASREVAAGVAAAVLLAEKLELSREEITSGLSKIKSLPGRVEILSGLQESLVINDTAHQSPAGVRAALRLLYEVPKSSKIAILGELDITGEHSKAVHTAIGELCDPKQLEVVITVGKQANKYIAAAAEKKGCNIMRCPSPDHALDVIQRLVGSKSVVLITGLENSVLAQPGELAATR